MSSKRDSNNLNDSNNVQYLAKKIKLEHKLISEKISKNHPDIDVHENEIYKFLLIFNEILEISLNDATDLTDSEGGIQDNILTVGKGLLKLLKGNIESLQLPAFLKNALKRLNSFLILIDNKIEQDGFNKNDSMNSVRPEMETVSKEASSSTTQTSQIWS